MRRANRAQNRKRKKQLFLSKRTDRRVLTTDPIEPTSPTKLTTAGFPAVALCSWVEYNYLRRRVRRLPKVVAPSSGDSGRFAGLSGYGDYGESTLLRIFFVLIGSAY
ncbi:hypothetical protein CEXT_683581 [Caerostris extrusa]|uniref:Uncharacterized protein n=1 Tax=Caerostris extrusa TaxID=172846 RepID=A0AAV4NF17_CAEEX|nr:hypothetical protein CEXT_683581 [Caerostris extrusa]